MSDPSARTFRSDFRRFFVRGLVILLPSVLTLWIVVKAYQFIDSAIAAPINRGVQMGMVNAAPYWAPLRNSFDPTQLQLEAAMAERAISRGLVTRDAVRFELRQSGIEEPTDIQVNAAIAERVAVTRGINASSLRTEMRSEAIRTWWAARWYLNLIGLIIAIVAVYITGYLLGGLLGRGVYKHIERLITSLPVFKQVYPYVKQIVDFLFSEKKGVQFNAVVLVEYPREGIWSIGFQTGSSLQAIRERAGDSVAIFIPSSPTPFTGYTITVPRKDVLELPISVEEAIRFVVSGGVLVPECQEVKKGIQQDGKLNAVVATAALIAAGTRETSSVAVQEKSGD